MNKINSFKIIELAVEGFKNFAEKRTFRFGSMNAITGHNGQGKSSIAEAIAYAIVGIPFFGTEQNLDRLYTIGGKKVTVELTIEVEDGSAHKLVRNRVNDKTDITYDGISIRQSDLTVMFGEKDVFLSIFNPLYFIEVLGNDGRNLLERYLPAVPHETILESLSEPIRALLIDKTMSMPETFLENIRTDIRELESTIIYVEGQRDLLDSQKKEVAAVLQQKQKELAETEGAITALETKRLQGINLAVMKGRLDALYKRYDDVSKGGLTSADTAAVDAEILTATARLEQRTAEVFVSKFSQPIAETRATVEQLKERYYKESAILKELAPGIVCPMCKQMITEQNIDAVKKSFDESIAAVMEKGREYSSQLSELLEIEGKSKDTFDQFKSDDVKNLQARITDLQNQRVRIIGEKNVSLQSRGDDLMAIKGQIQSLEADMESGSLSADEVQTLNGLRKIKDDLASEIAMRSDADFTEGAKFKADSDIDRLKESIEGKRQLETAVKFYIAERVRLMFAGFDMLQRVKIVLYDVVKKSGEIKDTFKFSYEDRPYRFLSLSEKIRAGLEISELMKRLAECNYPVFIDNGESVPVIDNIRPSGQVFVSQVVKGAPLNVEIIGGETRTEAKAA